MVVFGVCDNQPPSSPDLISSIPLVCFLPQVTVTGGVLPANLEDYSQIVIDKGLYFLGAGVSCPPCHCSIQ